MNNYDTIQLPVYLINLKERADRLAHSLRQFENKAEFDLHIIEAIVGVIAICLQIAFEIVQHGLWVNSAAARLVIEQH